ncbi:hypothetical protein FisN_4Hh545 [Fistulifera solaris]|uniref:Pentacotripeptide-repeat region of PRORP domain-containing protein n=1 Tax=Fistulifera solaris TaxID=1519565 RepID=A0A1Z5KIU9_FISSO|nr:hypothetical protein FisN_4Hh545 [Fistulifera solaris]|eukprot:GAX25971.1 hypothetical protein FisN_4Hh545 [Fistulifera solaris]
MYGSPKIATYEAFQQRRSLGSNFGRLWSRYSDAEDLEETLKQAYKDTKPKFTTMRESSTQPHAERIKWLRQATHNLIASECGTLVMGKWHEVISILKGWSEFETKIEAPIQMEKLLRRLVEERSVNKEVHLDIQLYNLVIDAWASAALTHSNGLSASQRARELLVTLQETYEASNDEAMKPNSRSFQSVLHAVCKTESIVHVCRLLSWMVYLDKSRKNAAARPRRVDFIKILEACADSGEKNAGAMVEGCMRQMKFAANIEPDTLCYNIAIKAYVKSNRGREAAEHAHRILDTMSAPPDLFTYSTVIAAWAASGMKSHAVSRAEEILRMIEDHPELEANTVALNSLMSAWVKSRNPAAIQRTHEIVRQMELSESAPPDLFSYNTLIHALSMHSAKNSSYAHRAYDVLLKMEKLHEAGRPDLAPNSFTYNLVIEAFARSRSSNAAALAAEVLRKLVKSKHTEPDTYSFSQVLLALSKSSMPGAADTAEKLFMYMQKSYSTSVHPYAKPDAFCLSAVIAAHARSGEKGAAFRAEMLMQQVENEYENGLTDLKPTRVCYNALIDCWSKSNEGTLAARKAENVLQLMRKKFLDGDESVAPNLITYNAVLNAWARSGTRCCARKAQEYLDQMWELYNAGDGTVKPNDLSYNTVINAISKSKDEQKAQKALRLLRRMDKLYQAGNKEARPNEVTYTAVLNSCAFPSVLDPKARRRVLDGAIFTLEELQRSRYGHPNQITYGTFIKACANLLPDDEDLRRVVLKQAFEQCCKDGQVGEMVLTHLRKAAPPDLYRELLAVAGVEAKAISVQDLPHKWRCNLPSEKKRKAWSRSSRQDV